jgi:ubiquinone/menaquinone biosynthesis C-methylase UbiE
MKQKKVWGAAGKELLWQILRTVAPAMARKLAVSRLYEHRARESGRLPMVFINYGYAPLDSAEPRLELQPEHEIARLPAQLYFHVAGQVELAGREVLEVGSGQGGGCQFIRTYLKARRVVGLDLSRSNVAISRRVFSDPAVSFQVGDAEQLPFPPSSFDAVVNVESSHHYPGLGKFLREVHRVLRPGGALLYADIFPAESNSLQYSGGASMRRELNQCPLLQIGSTDITRNVIASLDARAETILPQLRTYAGNEERLKSWIGWSRLPGTDGYQKLADRREYYMSFLFRKE